MLGAILGGLLVAWILTIFDFNVMLIEVIQPLIASVELTDSHYYVVFALLGLVFWILGEIFNKE